MKNIKNKISTLVLISAPILAASPIATSCSNKANNEVHILNINDIHGAIPGYGEDVVTVGNKNPGCLRLAKEVNQIIRQYPGSIFLSAGDENSGDPWTVCTHGMATYPVLKAMDCKYCAVGNHAFEWGIDDMASKRYDKVGRTDQTVGNYFVTSNVLSTNTYNDKEWCIDTSKPEFIEDFQIWQSQRVSWADPYKIIDIGKGNSSCKVCLIGLTTNGTLVDGNKKITQQLSFIDYNTAVHYTKEQIKLDVGQKQYDSIDSFILFTHCGADFTNKIFSGEAVELAATIDTDIDAIISAHSHKTGAGKIWNNKLNKAICVGQAGTEARFFLDTKIEVNSKAKKGKKLKSINMEVKTVPIKAKTDEEAKKEWTELRNSTDPDIQPVAKAYNEQRSTVEQKIGEVLSKVILNEDELQEPTKTKGYYNSAVHAGIHIGHAWHDCKAILDHFGGWYNRGTIIGYAMRYWDEIKANQYPVPSVTMSTQDSTPSEIQAGDIALKHMFSINPHENQMVLWYASVYQLANILNYSLSGRPISPTEGFNYDTRNKYEPDLNYFFPIKRSGQTSTADPAVQVAFNEVTTQRVPLTTSAYTCGMLTWYGIKANFVAITTAEKNLRFKNPDTGEETPMFDPTATLRVNTVSKKVKIYGVEKDMIVPDIQVYDGSELSFGTIDNPDAWHDAAWWLERQFPDPASEQPVKLIPMIINNFNYEGGNEQTQMFKPYAKYNILNYGLQFMTDISGATSRDLITDFCKYSTPDAHQWSEFIVPTNIKWQIIDSLTEVLS